MVSTKNLITHLRKVVQPTLANILGRKLLVSGTTSGTFLDSQPKKFPRMHSEIVLPGGLAKNQPQTVQISCNICAFVKQLHNAYFAEFIMQMPGKCRPHNFYHLILLQISKLIKLLL